MPQVLTSVGVGFRFIELDIDLAGGIESGRSAFRELVPFCVHWASDSVIYHSYNYIRYGSLDSPFHNFHSRIFLVAIKIGGVGPCRFDYAISLDYNIESCLGLWHKVERIQVIALVVAAIVS